MIRYIKDILDIKNILGAQRPQPLPAYPADQVVIRAHTTTTIQYKPIYTGDLRVLYTYGGVDREDIVPDTLSGVMAACACDPGTDVVLIGNVTQVTDFNAYVDFYAASNTITYIRVYDHIKTLDLRNADLLGSWGFSPSCAVETLYAIATTSWLSGISQSIISSSSVADGVLWIDRTQPYADSVITTARAKGWKVYYL